MLTLLVLLSLPVTSHSAVDNARMVKEYDALLARLPQKDPQRLPLLRRKADELYDVVAHDLVKDRDIHKVDEYRRTAISLYRTVLSESGAELSGQSRIRVQYQLARLLGQDGQEKAARDLFEKLENQNDLPRVRQESALYLGEVRELSNQRDVLEAAGRSYRIAAEGSTRKDLLTYIHYRLAWVEYRLGRPDNAVNEALVSLNDADKESRAQVLSDTLLFLAHSTKQGPAALAIVEQLEARFQVKGLGDQLADLYFTSDQRASYLAVSTRLQAKEFRLERQARIADLRFGTRDLANLSKDLKELAARARAGAAFGSKEAREESEKSLFRLTVELDNLASTDAGKEALFTDAADAYVAAFPASSNLNKVVGGYAARAKNPLPQLELWLRAAPGSALLRKTALNIAVKAKDAKAVLRLSDEKGARDERLTRARALLQENNFAAAEPELIALARVGTEKPDEIAIFSQNALLDRYAKEKNYARVIGTADSWKQNKNVAKHAATDAKLATELADQDKIASNARFELAATAASLESAKYFLEQCRKGEFKPKSCDNALALARKHRNPDLIIAALELRNDPAALASELESLGRFKEAAKARDELAETSLDQLHVAVLYELAGDLQMRDSSILEAGDLSKKKLDSKIEAALITSYRDADFSEGILNVAWSPEYKTEAASLRHADVPEDKAAVKILLEACKSPRFADGWRMAHLEELQRASEEMKKMSIVGRSSAKNFDKRVKLLEAQNKRVQCFLGGAPVADQSLALATLKRDYENMAGEIAGAPIPKELDEATRQQVLAQIGEAAKPFRDKAEALDKQILTLGARPAGGALPEAIQALADKRPDEEKVDWKGLVAAVRAQPYAAAPWAALRAHFDSRGKERLSAYLAGRVNAISAINKEAL